MLIYASFLVIDNTGFYLNVFYVNGGDMAKGALLKGLAGMCFQLGGLASVPGIVWLSQRIGKKNTFLLCTASLVVAGISKWFCYVPGAGWLLVIPSLLLAPGLVAVMVLVPSMTADICDLDEAVTGERREGMFNAVLGWMLKVALSGSIFIAGISLDITGWQTELKAAQTPATFLAMRIAFSVGTILFAVIAAACIAGYGVTEAAVAESRRRVDLKRRPAPST
jgi:GPH family glycoside/pentoside/hexuronide:cation symporter